MTTNKTCPVCAGSGTDEKDGRAHAVCVECWGTGIAPQPGPAESNAKECILTDSELTEKVEKWVTDLCHSKGKKWCLRVPADHNHDPDFLFVEAVRRMNRYASRISELEAENEKNIKWANDAETRAVAADERIAELEAENKRLREKAEKWDALAGKMEKFYAEDSDSDLVVIGEEAAAAFGYL